jgi:hypothetical protein
MRRTLVPMLAVLITLCQPMRADAMWWAWLEQWSGPGPFKAEPFRTFLFTACVQDIPRDREQADSFADIVGWRKRWTIQPSPIARSDTFHQAQDAIATVLEQNKPPGDASTKADFYHRLLANPDLSATWRMAIARTQRSQNRSSDAPRPEVAVTPEMMQLDPAKLTPRVVADTYGPEAAVGPGHDHNRLVCGYFDIGSFDSDGDQDPGRGFPPLSARVYDFGPSIRIHDGIDIGAGVGWVRFTGSGVDFRQGSFTPFRAIVRPLLLALPETKRRKWMGVFSFYWKEMYVWGRLTGADFGAPQSDFVEDGEMIRSFGINLDVTALLPVFNFSRR